MFVVIGWDNYFGFGFTTLIRKALYRVTKLYLTVLNRLLAVPFWIVERQAICDAEIGRAKRS